MEFTISGMIYASLGLLIVSFPYLFYILKSKRIAKDNSLSFQEFTLSQNLNLDKIQSWRNHYMLGLDSSKNTLVYGRQGQFPAQTLVRLDEIDHVRLESFYREVKERNERRQKLEHLYLVLHFKDSAKLPKSIPIYDADEVQSLADEIAIAHKWLNYLKDQLSIKQAPSELLQKAS